jgi:hypothetical protein
MSLTEQNQNAEDEINDILNWSVNDEKKFLEHENKEALQHHNHLKTRILHRERSHQHENRQQHGSFLSTNTTLDTIQLAKPNISHVETMFLHEDREVHFNIISFLEEFICQTLYAYLNVFAWPFVLPVSKYVSSIINIFDK